MKFKSVFAGAALSASMGMSAVATAADVVIGVPMGRPGG